MTNSIVLTVTWWCIASWHWARMCKHYSKRASDLFLASVVSCGSAVQCRIWSSLSGHFLDQAIFECDLRFMKRCCDDGMARPRCICFTQNLTTLGALDHLQSYLADWDGSSNNCYFSNCWKLYWITIEIHRVIPTHNRRWVKLQLFSQMRRSTVHDKLAYTWAWK